MDLTPQPPVGTALDPKRFQPPLPAPTLQSIAWYRMPAPPVIHLPIMTSPSAAVSVT